MYKPLADSTLLRMPKKEIIELLRVAEHNAKVSQEWVDQQAKNLKDWKPVVHAEWVVCGDGDNVPWMCSHCGKTTAHKYKVIYGKYCPNCGAKMDGGAGHEAD